MIILSHEDVRTLMTGVSRSGCTPRQVRCVLSRQHRKAGPFRPWLGSAAGRGAGLPKWRDLGAGGRIHRGGERGARASGPNRQKALARCKKDKATLVIARLDRLARNVHFISGLMETKVKFVACDMPEATPFMLHIYAAVAQEEARAISARTKAALAAAKQRGVRLGATGAERALRYKAEATARAVELAPIRVI